MPFTVTTGKLNVKNGDSYISINAIVDDSLENLEQAVENYETIIDNKVEIATDMIEDLVATGIPKDYTTLNNEVVNLKNTIPKELAGKASVNDAAALHVEVDVLKRATTAYEANNDERIDEIDNNIDEILENITEVEDQLATKAEVNEIAAAHVEIDRHETAINSLEERTGQLEANVYEQHNTKAEQNDVAALMAEVDQQEVEIQQIKDVISMKAEANDLATSLVDAENKVKKLHDEIITKAEINDLATAKVDIDMLWNSANDLSNKYGAALSSIADINSAKVNKPSDNGTSGQVLSTNGDGTTNWINAAAPTDAQIGEAVGEWLIEHPEATTTVEDGSITQEKLSPELVELIGEGEDRDAQILAAAVAANTTVIASQRIEISENVQDMERYIIPLKTHANRYLNNGFGFLFFTDPHNLSGRFGATPYSLIEDLRHIRTIYEHTPAKYVFCGGDWLNVDHLLYEAVWMVGRVQNLMQTEIGQNAYTVYGNHDDNKEGGIEKLAYEQVARMWFGTDKLYFILNATEDLDIYMLECDYSLATVSAHQWQEVAWLGEKLLQNTKTHLFGVGHILGHSESAYFSEQLFNMIEAFNRKTNIEINGIPYDFSLATGTWHFMIGGHEHSDVTRTVNGVPVIITDDFATSKAIDLCYADWDNAVLYLDRVGSGNSRQINIIPTHGYMAIE